MRNLIICALVGHWLTQKARRNAAEAGVFQAARNLRKQGVPLELARGILLKGPR